MNMPRFSLLRYVVVVFFITLFTHTAYAASWNVETVDTYLVGKFSSIAIDPTGGIHISYYDAFNGNVKYATNSGSGWHTEIVANVGTASQWAYTAIAVNTTGIPYIVFYDDNHASLNLAVKSGSTWSVETIDSATNGITAFFPSIALDSSGTPHVTYMYSQGGIATAAGRLKYAVKSGTTWNIDTVDSDGDTGFYTSIALDASNQPHISYVRYPSLGNRSSSILKYATQTTAGGAWTIEDVDSSASFTYTAIALDAFGDPQISYEDNDHGYLMYGTRSGGSWTTQIVDQSANVGRYNSIAVDKSGRPHISYYDATNQNLKYATLGAPGVVGWSTEVVDEPGDVGSYSDIAIDPSGLVHISYYDSTANAYNLKHAVMMGKPQLPTRDTGKIQINPDDFPYNVTVELTCTESVVGVCIHQEITRTCIGGNCFDVNLPTQPICVRCDLGVAAAGGFAIAAGGYMVFARRRRQLDSTSPIPPSPGGSR